MGNSGNWLADFSVADSRAAVDGLVSVQGYIKTGRPVEEVALMEKAEYYGADAVFFEAPHDGKAPEGGSPRPRRATHATGFYARNGLCGFDSRAAHDRSPTNRKEMK